MPEIRAICFDLFHTLVDVGRVPDHVGRYTADILGVDRQVWNERCFSAEHEIRRPTRHHDVIRTLAHSIDPAIPSERIAQAVEERQRRFDHALREVEAQTLASLEDLRARGLRLALVSNASTAEVAAWTDSPLAGQFDTAVFSCECGFAKPEPEIYRLACDGLGVTPEQALFVGDGGSDEHAGAAAVGMHPVLMRRFLDKMAPDRLAARRRRVRWEVAHLGELSAALAALG
jgi:putative hydrolase of the HAD superfamily